MRPVPVSPLHAAQRQGSRRTGRHISEAHSSRPRSRRDSRTRCWYKHCHLSPKKGIDASVHARPISDPDPSLADWARGGVVRACVRTARRRGPRRRYARLRHGRAASRAVASGQSSVARGSHARPQRSGQRDRKSTRLNSSHLVISYAVFCLKKKKKEKNVTAQVKTKIPYTKRIN